MIRLQTSVEDTGVRSVLQAVVGRIQARDILDEAGALLLNRIRTRFLAEQDPDGVSWIPSYAGTQRRAAGGTGTLFDTGTLFRSIQLANDGPFDSRIYTDVDYAADMQEGNYPGGVPRKFLGFGDSDTQLINALVRRRIEDIFRGFQ